MWTPPPSGHVKINFDGSVNSSSAATGFVIRDEDARPLAAVAKCAGRASVPTAEATAIRDSICFALEKGCTRIVVEGDDSKIVIGAVIGTMYIPWRLMSLVRNIN